MTDTRHKSPARSGRRHPLTMSQEELAAQPGRRLYDHRKLTNMQRVMRAQIRQEKQEDQAWTYRGPIIR
jgi:hypothetical protein